MGEDKGADMSSMLNGLTKYLGPWEPHNNGPDQSGFRREVLIDKSYYLVWRSSGIERWVSPVGDPAITGYFINAEQAMDACDKWLLGFGFEFLTYDQWDKMKVLL